MPLPSRFTPYGMLKYSSRQTHARAIYDTLLSGIGDSLDTGDGTLQEARLYAAAMCLGSAQYQLDRAANNRNPRKATELLPLLEQDYQIIPAADATLAERRSELAARVRVSRGNSQGAMSFALSMLLGDGFIEYRPTPMAEAVASPESLEDLGAYIDAGFQKKLIRLTEPMVTPGEDVTVAYTLVSGSQPPEVGERFSFDPDTWNPNLENVLVQAVGDGTITAFFNKPHEAGALGTNSNPAWISNKRAARIVVTLAVATDPEKRRRINEFMARAARGVTQWEIAHNHGAFTSDDPVLGLSDCTVAA